MTDTKTSPFRFLYSTERERAAFGQAWCGPDDMPHQEEIVVARYKPTGEDGHAVVVLASAWPARFYTICVAKPGAAYTITTGSGMTSWAADTAKAIASGMVGITSTDEIPQ